MNVLKKLFGNVASRVWIIVTCCMLALIIVASVVLFAFIPTVFDNLFGGDVSSGRTESGFMEAGIENKEQSLAYANAVNEKTCEEGFVLVKNENSALPVNTSAGKVKVSVFGKNSVNLVCASSGSSSNGSSTGKTIFDSLTDAGFEYNTTLKSFYENTAESGSGRPANLSMSADIPTGFETGETPTASYTDSVKSSFQQYDDLALIVISRTSGENNDVSTTMVNTKGAYSEKDHYLELDKNEQEMMEMVCENFDKVVLIVNSTQTFELGFLDSIGCVGDDTQTEYVKNGNLASKIDACLVIGAPGSSGIMALGKILNGSVNPSGRTVDTYARDFTKSPAYQNFAVSVSGKNTSDQYILNGSLQNAWYSDYEEGIYVGYRYYETRYATYAGEIPVESKSYDTAEAWYKDAVIYPFGYGLSYSQFNWEVKNKSALNSSEIKKDSTVNVTVNVSLAQGSEYAGKDVVELYVRTPYQSGGIEKADKVLCAFAKTELIQPDNKGGCDVTLSFDAYDIASYDSEGIKVQGGGYILEKGEYEFFVSKNAHESVDSFKMNVANDIVFENDPTSETKVSNLFDDVDDQLGSKLSRADWQGTWPIARTTEERTITNDFMAKINDTSTNNPITSDDEKVQAAALSSKKDAENSIQLGDMVGVDYDDERWEDFLDHITMNTIFDMVSLAAFTTPNIDYISKPKTYELDGPLGFTQFMSTNNNEVYDTCLYAGESVLGATWSVECAKSMGYAVGVEGAIGDYKDPYSGWYAPGVNLHRTPFGGRNNEYYSEDTVLSGMLAAAEIEGAWDKGVYTYMKHFVANESETHRGGVCTWMTEQTLRELYLKPFEIAIKKSDDSAHGVMSSFNRLGAKWTGGDYRLLTTVLRDEWGFEGAVITDFVTGSYMNIRQMAYAGGDLYLNNQSFYVTWTPSKKNQTDVYIMRNIAKHYFYVIANSNAMGGVSEEYSTRMADWKIVTIVIESAIVVALGVWGAVVLPKALKRD